jgi:hypothetical protein
VPVSSLTECGLSREIQPLKLFPGARNQDYHDTRLLFISCLG